MIQLSNDGRACGKRTGDEYSVRGKTNKAIAEIFGISVKTAMGQRPNLMEHLDIHNKAELVKFALERGTGRSTSQT
jgi:DNA-binding NarL/FixJ family response regulator